MFRLEYSADIMIKFDKRKSCYFEVECPPFGVLPVHISSDAYEMSMIKRRQFKFFGPVTQIEMGHKLNKSKLRETEKEVEQILPLWEALWSRSLDSVQDLREKWDHDPFSSGDEFEMMIMQADDPASEKKFVVEFNADGRWYIELGGNCEVLDAEVIW